MSKTIKYLICGTATLLLASCTADIQQEEPLPGLVPISVTAAGPAGAQTRAGMEVQESQFQAGETFYVRFATGTAVDAAGAALGSTLFTTTDDNGTTEIASGSPQPYFNPSQSSTTLYAYYPQTVTESTTAFEVLSDQRRDDNFKLSDLMFAETTALKRGTAVTIPLKFEHKLAKITIMAMAVDSVKSIKGIRIVSGYRGIDIANPVTCDLATTLTRPISESTPLQVYENTAGAEVVFCSAMLPPQTIEGKFLVFDTVEKTENGTENTTYTYPLRKTKFEGGHGYALALRVGAVSGAEAVGGSTSSASGKSLTALITDADKTYTGSEIHPTEIVIKDNNNQTLTENTDYKLIYSNAINVGRATVIVVGLGEYVGCVTTAYFNIVPKAGSIAFTYPTAEVTYWPYSPYSGNTYNGNPVIKVGEDDCIVTYSTEDTSVVTVDPETGKVTLLSDGTATIKATVTDGRNYHFDTPTATYVLTVLPATEIELGDNINDWNNGGNGNGTVDF